MTDFIITGSSTTSQTLNDNEQGIVGPNAILATTGVAIAADEDAVVSVYGVVQALSGSAINHTSVETAGALDLNVGQNGLLHAASPGSSGYAAVFSNAGDAFIVMNAGVIQSDDYAALYAYNYVDGYMSILNSGTLQGDYGIYSNSLGQNSTIDNSGTIQGLSYGIRIFGATGISVEVTNSGTISGSTYAYQGGDQRDLLTNSGTFAGDVVLGGGDDVFDNRGGHVAGEVYGGMGDDTFIVDSAELEIIESSSSGTDEVQSTVSFTIGANIENLELLGNDGATGWGNYLANVINGNDAANVLRGMGDNDTIYGEGGDDLIYGGNGDDTMEGNNGDDRLYGGINNDYLQGNDGNDNLLGEEGTDRLFGGDGNDSLLGGENNDNLNGDAGADTLEGGSGFDRLVGGAGDDLLTGNFNADTFIFNGNFDNDTITDFDANNDAEKIQLSGVSPIVDFADLVANHMTQVGSDVLIDAGSGNTITLLNVNIGDLDAVDFIF